MERANGFIFGGSAIALLVALAACSHASASPATGLDIGQTCRTDNQCASTNCMWEGDGAYCQAANTPPPACGYGGDGCTEGKHCCSDICNSDGTCQAAQGATGGGTGGNSPVTTCVQAGGACMTIFECCSANCQSDGTCAAGTPNTGNQCTSKGNACRTLSDCCSGLSCESVGGSLVCD